MISRGKLSQDQQDMILEAFKDDVVIQWARDFGPGDYSAWIDCESQANAVHAIAQGLRCRIKPEPRKVTRWLYAKEANILVEPRYSFDAYEHILVTYYPDEPDRDKRVVATLEDVK